MDILTIILVFCVVILLLYLAVTRLTSWPIQHTFRDMGIDTPPASKIFGNMLEGFKYGIWDVQLQFHYMFKGKKVYGWYDYRTPIIIARDLDLIKDIMIKYSSSNFTDRRVVMETDPPFEDNLLTLRGDHWKRVRSAISPTFSSGRLKRMAKHVNRNAKSLLEIMAQKQESNEEIELKEIMAKFSMDVVASTGFGLETDSLKEPDNEFDRQGKKFVKPNMTMFILYLFCPPLCSLLKKFGYSLMDMEAARFFEKVISSALDNRKESGNAGKVNDFLDLVIQAEKEREEGGGDGSNGLTRSEIYGQAVLFLMAGYETVSTVLSFTFFLLANHPEWQLKVQEELDEKMADTTEDVPGYDIVQTLTCLESCVNESMRMFPPGVILDRVCTEDITIQNIEFKKGQIVTIPVYGIHMDPDIWEEPKEFRPERFEHEQREALHPCAFMPFGHGPRNCVGMRLALLEVKMGLAAVLRKFNVVLCDKSVYPVKLSKSQPLALDGLWVKLERRPAK